MTNLTGFLGVAYLAEAAHVTFVIFWMAGLFPTLRLYVYHHETTVGSPRTARGSNRSPAPARSPPRRCCWWNFLMHVAFHLDVWGQLHVLSLLVVGLTAYQGGWVDTARS